MATIRRFEDVTAWQKARELAKLVYQASSQGKFAKDFELKNQINSACGSIMDNIAEGFGRGGRNEFVNFLSIAKGSCTEAKSQLYKALDKEYIEKVTFENLYQLADETNKLINGLMEYLNNSKISGQKFKNRTEAN